MKVNIYETVEVTDEQRVKLGAVLDGRVKPKRQATREELKSYIWEHGQSWETELSNDYARHDFEEAETGSPEALQLEELETEESLVFDDEDLIGEDEDLI